MKALTLTQPWATLVAIGAKRIETRSWDTRYRGPLAIHAAKLFPKWAREFASEPVCRQAVKERAASSNIGRLVGWEHKPPFVVYPLGYVIAVCRLANVIPVEVVDNRNNVFGVSLPPLSEQERAFGDYGPGRFAWILEDIELRDPAEAKGKLGLWEWRNAGSSL